MNDCVSPHLADNTTTVTAKQTKVEPKFGGRRCPVKLEEEILKFTYWKNTTPICTTDCGIHPSLKT